MRDVPADVMRSYPSWVALEGLEVIVRSARFHDGLETAKRCPEKREVF